MTSTTDNTEESASAATNSHSESEERTEEGCFPDPSDYEPDFDQRPLEPRDTFVGTPLYVSPEMLAETKSLPASDLWALGCIIYRMHVGQVPFEDASET